MDFISDERLARRAASGDQQAFGTIFRRYHQRLYRYCLAIVGNPEDAQDALQNAMVKAMRALPGEQRRIQLKPWLYRVAHNESIDLLRRRREATEVDPELVAGGAGLSEDVEVRERLRRLMVDLEALPERQRGALVMRELGGLDFEQIGAALGTSAAVARQTLYEARLGLGQMEAGREMTCETVTKALSGGDGRVTRRRDIRAHLRTCADCRRFGERISAREADLKALSPLPAVAAAGLLQALLGGGAGGSAAGGGLAGALGGGAAKTAGASAAAKGIATVAVVAAIGVGAADRGGLVDAGLPGGGSSSAPAESSGAGGAAGGEESGDVTATGGGDPRAGKDGDSRAAGTGKEKNGSGAEGTAVPASQGRSVHPHGRGHEKRHPAASDHGQQTAAEHKATPQHGGIEPNSAKPQKPAEPVEPSQPSKPAQPSKTTESIAPAPKPEKTPPVSPPKRTPEPQEEQAPPGPGNEKPLPGAGRP
jgi:RNA polymerase sigma factor (sigma-70 family)